MTIVFNTLPVSWNPATGHMGTGDSAVYARSVSNNGGVVVFDSNSPNLDGAFGDRPVTVPGIQYFYQLYAWDPVVGPTAVPVWDFHPLADPGSGSFGSQNYQPPIYFEGTVTNRYHMSTSADGRYVVFAGEFDWHLTNTSDVHDSAQIFRWDRQTNEVKLITGVDHTIPFAAGLSAHPMVSNDGAYIVFESNALNLPGARQAANGDYINQIYLWSQATNTISLVSDVDAGPGQQGAGANSFLPAISGDGGYVVFESSAPDLPGADGGSQIYRWDFATHQIVRLSDTNGAQAGGAPIGGHVAATTSNTLGEYTVWAAIQNDNKEHIVYQHNGVVMVVDAVSSTVLADGLGTSPAISADGRFVAFESTATDLLPGFGNGLRQIFIKDMATGMVTIGSATPFGQPGSADSFNASLSPDGKFVTYHTASSNLSGVNDGHTQVYETGVKFVTLEDTPYAFTPGLASSFTGLSAGEFALDSSGRVNFFPTEDFNGTVTFSYHIADNGTFADFLPDGTATFTVLAVNDAPSFSFNGSPTQEVGPGSGFHTVANFVTNLDKGAANESGQILSFLLTTDNPGMFSVGPTIGADGTLTYTLAANANGTANVSVQLKDDGGTAFGGVDASAVQTFTIKALDAAPFVSNTTPGNGTGNFAPDANLTVTFSEAVTLDAGAFTLMNGGTAVPFVLTSSGNTYTLNPTSDLNAGASYTLTVLANKVHDSDTVDPPDNMAADYVVGFIARAADAPPSVVGTTAIDGLPLTSDVRVAFSEDVNVTASSFKLMNGNTAVPFTLSGDGRVYTLNPTSDLARNTSYTLTVLANQVHDSDTIDPPDVMAADYVASFKTSNQGTNFLGSTLLYQWWGSNGSNAFLGAPATLTVGDGVELRAVEPLFHDYPWLGTDYTTIDISANTIHFEIYSTNETSFTYAWTPSGPLFTDTTNSLPRIVSAYISSETFNNFVPVPPTSPIFGDPFPENRVRPGVDQIWVNTQAIYMRGSFDLTVEFQQPTDLDLDKSATGKGFSATYIENGTRIAIADTDAEIFDSIEANMSGATIKLVGPKAGDQLSFGTLPTGITIDTVFTQADLITLKGTATKAAYQAALQQILFSSTSDDVSARTVEVTVFAGQTASNVATTTINITPVNDAPSASFGNYTILEDAGQQFNPSFAHGPGGGADEAAQTLIYSFTSDRPELFSVQPTVNPSGIFTFKPAANANGVANVTATVKDLGGTANGGVDTATTSFAITITPVNDAPENHVVNQSGNEDELIPITGVWITDPDAVTLTVDLEVGFGKLTLDTTVTNGVIADQVTFNGTAHVTVNATPDQINATLAANGLVYLGSPNYNGPDTLTITSNDNGGSPGPALQDVDTLDITVISVNDPPVAVDDVRTAVEAGGLNNAIAGVDPSGNVITTGAGADHDLDHSLLQLVISEIRTGAESDTGTAGTLGTGLKGQYGTLTMSGSGAYTYVVDNTNFDVQALNVGSELTDRFTYTVMDPEAAIDVGQLTITIAGRNDAPVAADDTGNAIEAGGTSNGTPGENATGSVFTGLGADEDVDDALLVIAVRTGTEVGTGADGTVGDGLNGKFGTLTLGSDGHYTYEVDDNNATVQALKFGQSLEDTFTYTVGAGGLSDQAQLTVTIAGRNDAPVATNDALVVTENSFVIHNVIVGDPNTSADNDSDVESDPIAVVRLTDLDDPGAPVGSATTVVLPIAPGTIVTDFGATVQLQSNGMLHYDVTAPGGNLAFNKLANGQTAVDTFTYTISDGELTDTGTVSVTITGVNDPITAVADTIATVEDNAPSHTGSLVANDTDIDDQDTDGAGSDTGDTKTITQIVAGAGVSAATPTLDGWMLTLGSGITIALHRDGTYRVQGTEALAQDQLVSGAFNYTVQDGGGTSSTTSVSVAVTGREDAPVITVVATDSVTLERTEGNAGLTGNGTLTVTDVDVADTVTASVTNVAVSGSGAGDVPAGLTQDLLSYLTVTPAPVIDSSHSTGTLTWHFNSGSEAFDFLAKDKTLTLTYTVRASDNSAIPASDDQTITVTITGSNDAPVGVDDAAQVDENAAVSGVVPGVLGNDTDADANATRTVAEVNGNAANVGVAVVGTYGTLTLNLDGSYTYVADQAAADALAAGATKTDTFSYTVSDGIDTDTADLVITVTGVNDAPVITLAGTDAIDLALNEGNAGLSGSGTLTVTDVDVADTVTASVTNVAVSGSGKADVPAGLIQDLLSYLTVTPAPVIDSSHSTGTLTWHFNSGSEAFDFLDNGETLVLTYTVRATDDSTGAAFAEQTITVTIAGSNDAPTGVDDAAQVDENAAVSGVVPGVLGNDTDADAHATRTVAEVNGNAANVGVAVVGTYGTLTLKADGSYTYVADQAAADALAAGATKTDTFSYTVSDGTDSDKAELVITVNGLNDAPVPGVPAKLAAIGVNSGVHLITQAALLVNASDVDGPPLKAIDLQIAKGAGSLVDNNNGSWTYTPKINDDTQVDFIFQVTDGVAAPVAASATLDIESAQASPALGSPGDDSYTAVTGNSVYEGGLGVDSIAFDFKLTDAIVSYSGNQIIIDGPTSHTVVTGMEVFQFTDGTVNNADGDRLVDDLFYYSQNHDVWTAGADADAHYHTFGWKEARDPDALFSTSTYLSLNPAVKTSGVDPLSQFDQAGWKTGGDPSIAFDTSAYLDANPDVKAAGIDPLAHYLNHGYEEGRQPIAPSAIIAKNDFDYVYYLKNNPDVAAAHVDPLQHFETFGWKEGRNPNALFDLKGYLDAYADVKAAGVNPLDHYNAIGWQEGRDPSAGFDTTDYLSHYQDVAAAHINPLMHYLQYGQAEGRSPFADGHFG